MARTIGNGRGFEARIFLDLLLGRWVHRRAMFQYGVENSQFFLKYLTCAQSFLTKNLPSIDGTKRQQSLRKHFGKSV